MNFPERERTADNLKILKDGHEYVLPAEWSLSDACSYDFNNKIGDRAFSHGGDVVGDGMVKGHTIKVKFSLKSKDEFSHDELLNRAYRYFAQTDYKLYCGRSDRCFNVASISKITHEYENGFKQRWSNITVSLLLADPFRYDVTQTVITTNFISEQNETKIIVENPSSVDVPLIFTFIPPEGSTTPDIAILHVTSGQRFILKDTLLTAPAISVVNGETGTVRRDTGNSLNTFNGIFLHAFPGENIYEYTGAACKVNIAYTARWFI